MTLEDRISQFIGKALTRLRVLQTELIEEFDYRGYLNDNAEELLLQISETYDYIDLISSDYKGGMTEKEIRDLIDFFYWWLELAPVIAANYVNYQMPIEGNITIPGGGGGGYATTAALNAEIAARIAADQALSARITALEESVLDPSTIFPEGFFDNYIGSYSVVFDDDPRLHLHANLVELDQITGSDLANIKALTAHFESVGTPGGMHVSQEDRDRWDAGGSGGGGSATQSKFQVFVAPGGTSIFTVTNGVINQVNFVAINTAVQPPGSYTLVGNAAIDFGTPIPAGYLVHIAYFQDLLVVEGAGGGVYDLTSPSTIPVGGMPAGTVMTGRTWQSLMEEIAVEYQLPGFSSFALTSIPAVVEVGVAISGAHNFTWSTSNSFNVLANSINIRDVTANVLIASNLANDGAESVGIGTIPNTAPMSRSWRAEGRNSLNVQFNSGQDTVTSLYPYFYGKVASGGLAPGLGRPAASQALINAGSKVVANSNGTISINFNSSSDDYIWFAIPAISANKNVWFVSLLNNGSIGGPVTPGGNLFPAFDTISVDSPTVLWSGINYKVYVSNYQTAIAALMELRNS